jgi:membrane protein required for colicin V production
LLGLLLAFTIYGFSKGFIHEVFVMLGLSLGVWFGIKKPYFLKSFTSPIVLHEPWNHVVCFIIIFLIVFAITMLLSFVIKRIVKAMELEWLNRVIGGFYGFLQGVVIIWVFLLIILIFNPSSARVINQSLVSKRILSIDKSMPYLSGELTQLKNQITKFITKTKINEGKVNKVLKHQGVSKSLKIQ